jgi:hypothetical protein
MDKSTLKRIFEFLHKKEGTLEWKFLLNEPLTEEDLNIEGDLDLSNTKITSLPEGLKGLHVGGDLNLFASAITSLPENMYVGGNLNLNHTRIKLLPIGLKVIGNIYLKHCRNIVSLPKGLEVNGDIVIEWTNLTRYNDNKLREMVYPGYIKGEIDRKTPF